MLTILVHVDNIFAAGKKARCDQFGRDLNQMVPIKDLQELRSCLGCVYERGWKKGTLNISQRPFAEQLASKRWIEYGKGAPLSVGMRLVNFDKSTNETPGGWPFRELVSSFMWLSPQIRPHISNAVRSVARYCAAPKVVHWREALGILVHVIRTSSFGTTFQQGTIKG